MKYSARLSMLVSRLLTALVLFALVFPVYAQSAGAQAPPALVYSQNPEANALFLQAREYVAKSDPHSGGKLANARQAIKLYEQATQKDLGFALAYVEMGRAWLSLNYTDPDGASVHEFLPPARAAAMKAVELGPNLPEAHLLLAALAYNFDYDWPTAEREYQLGIKLRPQNAIAHAAYAAYLNSMGRFAESLDEAAKAEALTPSLSTDVVFVRTYYSMRSFDKATEYCKKSLARTDNVLGHVYLGFIGVAEGQYDQALREFKAAAATNNRGSLASLAYGYAMAGDKNHASELLDKLNTGSDKELEVPYRVAAVYLALGEKDKAFESLGKAYVDHDNWMNQLKVDPVMDPLRSDPRFGELMRKMRLG